MSNHPGVKCSKGLRKVYVHNEFEAHALLKESFKHGDPDEFGNTKFYEHNSTTPMFRVGAILKNGYVLIYPNGDSILTKVGIVK